MNAKVKDTINGMSKVVGTVFSGFSGTVASLFRILVLSSMKVAVTSRKNGDFKKHENCSILANGPSLKAAIENNEVQLDSNDVFCVNSFCESEYFWKIKPQFYFVIDGTFFNPTIERTKKQVASIVEAFSKVDWDMCVVVPSYAPQGGIFAGLNNPHIKTIRFNSTSVSGYDWFCNMVYKQGLGMPTCINVVIFAISSALFMGYKNIYMYGIDHTFSAQLFVNENNVVCSSERHVYSTEPRIFKLPQTTMARILGAQSLCFSIHEKLERMSKKLGCKIYNCTKGSFVDAYERLK